MYRMDKVTVMLLFLVFSTTSDAQFDNKLSDFGLKGKVRSVAESEYQIDDYDLASQVEIRRTARLFNQNGYKTDEEYSLPTSEVSQRSALKYSPQNELLEEKTDCFGKGENYTKNFEVAKGNISVKITRGDAAPVLHAMYSLDSQGRVVRQTDFNGMGAVGMSQYTYSAGRLQSEVRKISDSEVRFAYKYNASGLPESKREVSSDGKVLHTHTFAYDGKGNLVSEISSYAGDPEKISITYKYTFDSAGNWTEKQEFMNGNLFSVVKRTIMYYN
jgi:hypothetical protein